MQDNEKIINLSDAELESLQFIGLDAVQQVTDFIAAIKKAPKLFEWLTIFQLQCLSTHLKYHPGVSSVPNSSAHSEDPLLSSLSETTAAAPDLVSPFERAHFYTGVSEDPPLLFHRSDLLEHPFVITRARFSVIPEKRAHSANHPILKNKLWKETVAPEIIALLKDPSRGVRVSTMLPVRFSTPDDDGRAVFDDYIVLWISVHPNTTKETSCRDANAAILALLAKHGIQDVAVHWIEGAVELLARIPPMMRVVRDTDPTHYIRRALTAVLGVPLAADTLANGDVQPEGSLGLFFFEGKDRHGNPSNRLMCSTDKHATSSKTTKNYEYRSGARRFIHNCGSHRFQQILNETRALIATKLGDTQLFAEQLAEMSAKPASEDEAQAQADEEDEARKRQDLERAASDVAQLSNFFQLLTSTWSDAYQRIIGHLDWAPKIAHGLDERGYTRDLAVIALDESKFKDSFQGNAVYLAGKYTRAEVRAFFDPSGTNTPAFTYPRDHLLRLSGCVDAAGLAAPHLRDEHGRAGCVVAKAGQATGLTFGRLSALEAYTCDAGGRASWEAAVFNFSGRHGSFARAGDSGAAVVDAEGRLAAVVHSGMLRGGACHVAFGTPGHYVVELIRERYPHADFECGASDA